MTKMMLKFRSSYIKDIRDRDMKFTQFVNEVTFYNRIQFCVHTLGICEVISKNILGGTVCHAAWDKIIIGTCNFGIFHDAIYSYAVFTTIADSLYYGHLVSEQFVLSLQYGVSVSSKAMSFTVQSYQVLFLNG